MPASASAYDGHEERQLDLVNFWCPACRHRWRDEPENISDNPDAPWHPWTYSASCPECGQIGKQAHWERGLLRAWANSTGPKNPQGFKNQTPEQIARRRFNAVKHGHFARVATYYPAKPGKYPHCKTCEWLHDGCGEGEFYACAKRTELFIRHRMAMETRDPSLLLALRADLQANLTALLDDMILAVTQQGVVINTPEWALDKEGNIVIAQYIDNDTGRVNVIQKVKEHPLIPRIFEAVQRNALTLSDLGMTPKSQEENEILRGQLDAEQQNNETVLEFQRKQTEALENLQELIARSRERAKTDPVLLEHQQNESEG